MRSLLLRRGTRRAEAPRKPLPRLDPAPSVLLFDLDGTLVRMRKAFLELWFVLRAARRLSGVIPWWRFRRAVRDGLEEMQHHGTCRTNHQALLHAMARHGSGDVGEIHRRVRTFYEEDFPQLSREFFPIPGASETLRLARRLGYRLVLATNPVFPLSAVRRRMDWGGVGAVPFEFISHSETMTRCKPDPGYYRELLDRIGRSPGECLMIGNDPRKDLPAREIGIRTFLVDTGENRGILEGVRRDPRLDGCGPFEDLRAWLTRTASPERRVAWLARRSRPS